MTEASSSELIVPLQFDRSAPMSLEKAGVGDASALGIIGILSELSCALGIPVITPEYEIGLALLDRPGLTAEQLIEQSSFSRSGFFKTMDRLKHSGDIVSTTSPIDRRSRHFHLSEGTRDLIVSRFRSYRFAYEQYVNHGGGDLHPIKDGVLRRRRRAFGNLSCEFRIIYFCHVIANINNNELSKLIDVSPTKFLAGLRALSTRRLINSVTDLTDRRRKMYNVNPNIRRLLDDFHDNVFRWLDRIAELG